MTKVENQNILERWAPKAWILVVVIFVVVLIFKNLKNKKKLTPRMLCPLHHPSLQSVSVCSLQKYTDPSPSSLLPPFSVIVNNNPILHFLKINDQRKADYQKIPKTCGNGWVHRLWRKPIWLQIMTPPLTGSRIFRKTMKTQGKPAASDCRKTQICRCHPGLFREVEYFYWVEDPSRPSFRLCWVNVS